MAKLLLAHVSGRPEQVRRVAPRADQPTPCLFLCQDYLQRLKWEGALGPGFRHVEISGELAEAAKQLRQPFLDRITELGRCYDSLGWWTSRVSERNTAVSPLFLYCCYLHIGIQTLGTTTDTLCVIGESWEVLESLADHAYACGYRVQWLMRPVPGRRQALLLARVGKRLIDFIGRTAHQMQRASDVPTTNTGQPTVLLRTFVDEACFGEDGVFYDRYLPGLCDWLEAQGYAVATIPVLFNLNRSYRSAWKWLRRSRQQFLNPYAYYCLGDYLFALRQSWQQRKMPKGPIHLDEMDVSRLFQAERERPVFGRGSLESILSYRLPRRLAEAGFRVDLFIAEFENMIPEKAFILGFRRYLPDTKLVGYQHGALYPLLLCNFITPGEAEFAPMPDRVVCNGEFFRDILIREGLPPDRAVVGPALRYTHLWQLPETEAVRSDDRTCILVPLPLVPESAVELLIKTIYAFENVRDLQVMLKAHPMSSPDALLRAARLTEFPPHFQFVQGSMSQWLAQVHVVVAMSSSTIHEALAAGVPVIVVGRETALDLNPLAWYADLNRVFHSPDELRAEALRLGDLSQEDLASYKERAKDILHTSFRLVTDDAMRAFVDELVPVEYRR